MPDPRAYFDLFRGFQRAVYVVASARFVNVFGSGVVYPFATLYFVAVVGLPFTLVGAGLFANSVATAVGTAMGGYLADRYGRKPLGFGVGPVVGGAFFDYGYEMLLWPALVGMCAILAVGLLVVETRLTPAENGHSTAT